MLNLKALPAYAHKWSILAWHGPRSSSGRSRAHIYIDWKFHECKIWIHLKHKIRCRDLKWLKWKFWTATFSIPTQKQFPFFSRSSAAANVGIFLGIPASWYHLCVHFVALDGAGLVGNLEARGYLCEHVYCKGESHVYPEAGHPRNIFSKVTTLHGRRIS